MFVLSSPTVASFLLRSFISQNTSIPKSHDLLCRSAMTVSPAPIEHSSKTYTRGIAYPETMSDSSNNEVVHSSQENNSISTCDTAVALDPNDVQNPQNWSPRRKNAVFIALMSSSILCDGGVAWGASLFVAQALEWNISVARSSTSINYGLLMNGLGGVIAVPFIESFGRFATARKIHRI